MSVEGPSRIPTRRQAERTAPAATAPARSVSRSPGATGDAGSLCRLLDENGRWTRSERTQTNPADVPQTATDGRMTWRDESESTVELTGLSVCAAWDGQDGIEFLRSGGLRRLLAELLSLWTLQ